MTLIDLDRPAPAARRREPGRRRRRRIVATGVLMVVAAGLGGFATYRWQQHRDGAAVQVVVVADLNPSPPGPNGNGKVRVVSHLGVVNTRPAPVRMVAVNVAALGMRADAWMPVDELIAPGRASYRTIVADVDCRNSSLPAAAPPTVEVAAADGTHRRRVAVTAGQGAWSDQLAQACPK
jgi:hypothetical protein